MDREEEEKPRTERRERSRKTVAFGEYLRRIRRRAEKTPFRFRFHTLLFGAANAFLVLINLVTGIGFPWFVFPLGSWLVVLANHYVLLRQHRRQDAEVGRLDGLSPYQTDGLRRLHRQRSSFSLAVTSAAGGALLLGMTNLIVSPHFPWAVITAGALGLAVLAHYLGYSSARSRLTEQIGVDLPVPDRHSRRASLLLDWRRDRRRIRARAVAPEELRRAFELRERIDVRLAGLENIHGTLGAEIGPLLDRFIAQIARLARGRDEIEQLTGSEVFDSIAAERTRLDARKEAASSPVLEEEYRRAIAQLDVRLGALRRLREQGEVASLRIDSALHSLEQLEIEVVRLQALSDVDSSAVSKMIENKVEELAAYVADFDNGRRELETS